MVKEKLTLSNGSELAFIERAGADQALVLLHGITDNALTYQPLLEGIDARCHVYALDFRGHGESSRPNTRYDTAAYADDVLHFIHEQVGKPVLLAGHSLGGVVAVQCAISGPSQITSIFLEDPPLYFVGNLDATYQQLFNALVVMASTLQDGTRSEDEWFDVMANAPDPYSGKPGIETMGEDRIRKRLDSVGMLYPKALQDALDGSLVWDADAVLTQLSCPVTMMTGNRALGAVVTDAESARVAELVDDCTLVNVPDVGHLLHDLTPDIWLTTLNEWIDRHAV